MSRRKILKGFAYGLLGTFVSRNNDIEGYWGLGILRLYAEKHKLSTITIDLLKSKVEPSIVTEAKIDLRFSTFVEFPRIVRDTRGQPYVCSVKIVTRNGKIYSATRTGCCEGHNPTKERRSVHDNPVG